MDFPFDHRLFPASFASSLLWLVAFSISAWFWWRREKNWSEKSLTITMGGIAGGLLGAKIFFVLAEAPIWWSDHLFWIRMLVGKTILGGLLGGWLGIEIGKKVAGESRILGDEFARIIPIGILIGRLGCQIHGCCPGAHFADTLPAGWAQQMESLGLYRWPAPTFEIIFQLLFLLFSYRMSKAPRLKGQHFHVYMMAYGSFRFAHEFIRATVRYGDTNWSPYMWLALLCLLAGTIAFHHRQKRCQVRMALSSCKHFHVQCLRSSA